MPKRTPPIKDDAKMNLLQKRELTVQEAANLLNLSRQTVYNMMLRGEIQESSRTTLASGVKVSTQSVIEFMQKTNRPIPVNKKHSS